MTPTTSQAVRDAQMELADAWFLGPREATRALANFESAVRADEAAGLVDILARSETLAAAVVPLFDGNRRRVERVDVDNFPVSWRFTRDEYNAIYDALASFREGMNAVAERRGQ